MKSIKYNNYYTTKNIFNLQRDINIYRSLSMGVRCVTYNNIRPLILTTIDNQLDSEIRRNL